MPVLLDPGNLLAWLDPRSLYGCLLQPCADEVLVVYPVDGRVNNARVDDPGCVRALTDLFHGSV